jgi:hypothetical protein
MTHNDEKLSELLTVDWLIEGKALLLDLKGPPVDMDVPLVDMQELLDYQDRLIIEKLDTAANPVHLVIKMPQTDKHPPAKDVTSFKFQSHPRLGDIILVGLALNPVARFLMMIVGKVRNLQVKNFNTLDEATAYIKRVNLKAD